MDHYGLQNFGCMLNNTTPWSWNPVHVQFAELLDIKLNQPQHLLWEYRSKIPWDTCFLRAIVKKGLTYFFFLILVFIDHTCVVQKPLKLNIAPSSGLFEKQNPKRFEVESLTSVLALAGRNLSRLIATPADQTRVVLSDTLVFDTSYCSHRIGFNPITITIIRYFNYASWQKASNRNKMHPKNLLSLVNGHYKFNLKAYLAWSQFKEAWMLKKGIELEKKNWISNIPPRENCLHYRRLIFQTPQWW